ncbi:uncharacterized protein CTHT_0028830 [Thermochaetoides thermophila DSM 1495]|uniref:Inactive metallocarboxypeptidase ECM14 n=1 Tax=Chaetomium thermophilum (strain DSM 1495 / CBS 144.50 / IMI 039719) TaxID=759272 RepID=G0S7U3_CHATD|nr:hypothetical protein CTHT_0028830 [Thermochaetoides thermophila DSM 1495]EGS21043.1 hypothetical protein CTHT_0028830 [Thermochaetoides thermophila DSM 1495]
MQLFLSTKWAGLFIALALVFTLLSPASAVRLQAFPRPWLDANITCDPQHQGFQVFKWLRDGAGGLFSRPFSKTLASTKPSPALYSRYKNDVVIRFNVTTPEEEHALAQAADQMFLDIWAFTPDWVDVRIRKDDVSSLLSLLPRSLRPSVLIHDVAAAVWATYPSETADNVMLGFGKLNIAKMKTSFERMGKLFFRDYQTLAVITNWLRLLETMFPSIAGLVSIGKSYEGRDILALRVGAGNETKQDRKTILIAGGLHGREWISTSTINYLVWSVLTSYEKDRMITKLLKHFDLIFIPVLNPDGYEYTWQTDRLWRKSRQQTKLRFCRGMDLDHAFGYAWEDSRHQTDPCSESYGGDQPFEAIEAFELAKWAKSETANGVKFVAFLDLHSYSQQVLFPYAYSCSVDPPNKENLEELAIGLAKALRRPHGERYRVDSACEGVVLHADSEGDAVSRVEAAGGSAIDWFYHDLRARYSYQIKLRDTGSYGFLLPSKQIVPTGEETLNALKYLGDYLLGNNGIESSPFRPSAGEWKDLRGRRR